MIFDDLHREHLIRELEDIRFKISQLADNSEDAGAMQNELAVLGLRIEQLTAEFRDFGTPSNEVPAAKVILVVDDNDELRTFIKQALELSDYNILEASDGEEALAVLQNSAGVDLVLCDVILPGMKGPDLVKKIRGRFPDVKVIFMSGYIAEDIVSQDVEQIVAAGGNFLQKPFPTRKMLETIHDALEN